MAGVSGVTITLNGREKAYTAPLTVRELLQDMGMADRRVAVELKQRLVELEQQGRLNGLIELVPVANPIGLIQHQRIVGSA